MSEEEQSGAEPGDVVRREALVERFRLWLEETWADEPPPEGVPAEVWAEFAPDREGEGADDSQGAEDLFGVWSALTALTQETRLQGRAFKQLHERLEATAGLGENVGRVLSLHQEALADARRIAEEGRTDRLERERELRRNAERRVRLEMLADLVATRDRLLRGLEGLRSSRAGEPVRRGWLAGILGGSARDAARAAARTAAMEQGYSLSLDFLDEKLAGYHVREIECADAPFDPRVMEAVDREETSRVAAGTVLEVYQRGYLWQGELFRPARVKVAAPAHTLREQVHHVKEQE